ncbi:hypothetical protein [Methanolobus sp.]|uniref:hypothetical protein n=1 Tax=Methanolobus sp. TaxID=1874737 RepID=UPI0026010B5D|nr:hypothetical protein [Methanolobus sp.]
MGVYLGKKVIFVYNADSGIFNSIEDYVHKIVSPSTYGCNLCGLTYGNMGMKNNWKQYISGQKYPVEFLHKDVFFKKYNLDNVSFPCAYIEYNGKIELLITSDEINYLGTLEELMLLVSKKLADISD